jgi:hypothetical protein
MLALKTKANQKRDLQHQGKQSNNAGLTKIKPTTA